MAVTIFLVVTVIIWLPYGVFCAIQPSFLAGAAGVVASSPTGTTELRAMYGGLQAGIGSLGMFALLRPRFRLGALVAISFLTGGLGFVRLLGVIVDGSGSGYTWGALAFETINTAVAVTLARKEAAGSDRTTGGES